MNVDVILGVIRHALTFGGGYLVTAGYADQANVETGVGALVTLLGLAWSIAHKVKAK